MVRQLGYREYAKPPRLCGHHGPAQKNSWNTSTVRALSKHDATGRPYPRRDEGLGFYFYSKQLGWSKRKGGTTNLGALTQFSSSILMDSAKNVAMDKFLLENLAPFQFSSSIPSTLQHVVCSRLPRDRY